MIHRCGDERQGNHRRGSKSCSDATVCVSPPAPLDNNNYSNYSNNNSNYNNNNSNYNNYNGARTTNGIQSQQPLGASSTGTPHQHNPRPPNSVPQQQNTNTNTNTNTNRIQDRPLYIHGRRPSLAGFDPFSSEQPPTIHSAPYTTSTSGGDVPTVTSTTPGGAGRDCRFFLSGAAAATATATATSASDSVPGNNSSSNNQQQQCQRQRQPPTSVVAAGPVVVEPFANETETTTTTTASPVVATATTTGADAAKPPKIATSKGPMKKVHKFLRRSVLAKSLSLGSNNNNRQSMSMSSSTTTERNLNPSGGCKSAANANATTTTASPVSVVVSLATAASTTVVHNNNDNDNSSNDNSSNELGDGVRSSNHNHSAASTALQIPSLAKQRIIRCAPTSFLMNNNSPTTTTTTSSSNHHYYCETAHAPLKTTTTPYYEPTPFQLEIPSLNEVVTIARLNEFVENYRRQDQHLDLRQFVGLTKHQLRDKLGGNNGGGGGGSGGATAAPTPTNTSASTTHSSTSTTTNLVKEHVPIVQSLLDCSEHDTTEHDATTNNTTDGGGEISVQGFLTEPGDHSADDRTEAVIFQGQRNFTVVFRGTTEQQARGLLGGSSSSSSSSKSKKRAVPLDDDDDGGDSPEKSNSGNNNSNGNSNNHCTIEVYSGFKESYSRVEEECFEQVDKLVDENPFCDVVFSGYSFGGALATLAAFRYATARPMVRVGCLTLASPRVGFSRFKQAVDSLPNLRVMRLELGRDANCQGPTTGGSHVGHTVVLNHTSSNSNKNNNSDIGANATSNGPSGTASSSSSSPSSSEKKPSCVSIYKFATPKHKNAFFKTSNPGLKRYISTLEDLATLHKNSGKSACSLTTWANDFANNAGEGVVVNNEKRQMV